MVLVWVGTVPTVMRLNSWPTGSSTTKRRGLIGGGVVLLDEVCHCGGRTLRSYMLKPCPV